jgi:Effector-associated domain 11
MAFFYAHESYMLKIFSFWAPNPRLAGSWQASRYIQMWAHTLLPLGFASQQQGMRPHLYYTALVPRAPSSHGARGNGVPQNLSDNQKYLLLLLLLCSNRNNPPVRIRNPLMKDLIKLIESDRAEECLDLLIAQYGRTEELVMLKRRLSAIKQRNTKGTISVEDYDIERTKVSENLLYLLNKDEKKEDQVEDTTTNWPSVILSICLLLSLIYAFYYLLSGLDAYVQSLPTRVEQKHSAPSQPLFSGCGNKAIADPDTPILEPNTPYIIEKRIQGFDKAGRLSEYILFIVRDFNWVIGEETMSEHLDAQLNVCEQLQIIGIKSRINREDLKSIVCFGNTCSKEDPTLPKSSRRSQEEDRASKRAHYLGNCVSYVLEQSSTPITLSVVGQYTEVEEITDYQREIIIVGVLKNDVGVEHPESLFDAFYKLNATGELMMDISKFSLVKNETLPIVKFM